MKRYYAILAAAAFAATIGATALPVYAATDCTPVNATSSASKSKWIDEKQAQKAALKQVPGAKKENITKCELDKTKKLYMIEIKCNNKTYEINVNAENGNVVKSNKAC